jgi:hypothetical protein
MNKILTIIFLLIATKSFSQTDKNGNPVFNSITTKEETIQDFQLSSNYYLLKTNIENKKSSVYISDNPTLKEIANASVNLPSDFFLITRNQGMLNLVMLQNYPKRQFFVINPETGKQYQYPCSIKGDITENRTNEIIKEKYDPNAKIKGNKLIFNNNKLTIISTAEIKKAVIKLIEKEKLNVGDNSNVKLLTKEEIKTFVLTESKQGGKLDFFTEIIGHENDGIQVKPGIFDTKLGIALYKWGRANFEIGTNIIEDAFEFWTEYKGREINGKEKVYIKMGFNKELEK